MILWHKNFHIADSVIENMSDWLKHTKSTYVPKVKHYTSYNLASTMRPEYPMRDFYAKIAEECMRDLTLFERSRYTQSFWMQLYEPGSNGHPCHDHFSGEEICSWVHFLKPVKKAFHFLVDGKKVYPEQQNAGDFIVFPSWALHQVDINDTFDDRVVMAGNILWDTLNTVKEGKVTKQTKCFSVSDTLCLWESKYV